MKIYNTERLYIKPVDIEDAAFILKLYNTPKFIKYIGDRNLKNIQDAEDYIREKFLPSFEKYSFGNYIVIQKSDSEKIGAVGIFRREGIDVPDIGFSFLEEFEGKGFAYEAASEIKKIGIEEFGLEKISAITSKENFSSQKLIKKLGLVYKKNIMFPFEGKMEESYYYEL